MQEIYIITQAGKYIIVGLIGVFVELYPYPVLRMPCGDCTTIERRVPRYEWETNPVKRAIYREFDQISYDVGDEAMQVGKCESEYDPTAKNPHSTGSGVFQILRGTWKGYKCTGDIFDPDDNVKCAVKIYTSNNSWKQWQCKPNR